MTDEAKQMGRPAIFRNKTAKNIHGMITKDGEAGFEIARRTLAKLVDWPIKRVSDGDVIVFLCRGFRLKESADACTNAMLKYLKTGK